MEKKSKLKIGMSASASWAWGTSLIMGQQIAQQKGILAWIIWAVCNTLTLAIFGYLYNHKHILKDVCYKKGFKEIALLIQLFCLLVQLNFINKQVDILSGNSTFAYICTAVIGAIFVLIVYNKGLKTSIFTDVFQWGIAIVAILVILSVALITKQPLQTFNETSSSGVLWGVWSGLVLFAGPIGDVQHWQRADYDDTKTGYYFGSLFFGMYMLLILAMACFEFSPLMNAILLIAVLCVTTSTIDSIAVALHEVHDKRVGTAVSLGLCLTWGLLAKAGMIDLWSSFGVIRFAFAVAILLYPLKNNFLKIILSVVSWGVMLLFAQLGFIVVTSTYGIICMVVALLIMLYIIINAVKGEFKKCN